ncbi:MAG TPA: RDD family protein, partial [Burkholderiaceae bacterium]|nr:RDD family protein [Burkholderiaceae bacterium]
IVAISAVAAMVAVDSLGVESASIKIACAILAVLLLEPLAVAFTGGTIGHHLYGIRVRRKGSDRRLNVFAALARFAVKTAFGIPSFFVALISNHRQSLHDLVAHSVVIHKSAHYDVLPEITRDDEQRTYLSIWRRLLVIILYWALYYFGVATFCAIAFNSCLYRHVCGDIDSGLLIAIGLSTPIAFVLIGVFGWRGKLYGCRKKS